MPAFDTTLAVRATAIAASAEELALSTSIISPMTETMTEPEGNNYDRATPSWGSATTDNPSTIENNAVVSFPPATGSWGTIRAVAGILIGETNEFIMWYDAVDDEEIDTGNQVIFTQGEIAISVSTPTE